MNRIIRLLAVILCIAVIIPLSAYAAEECAMTLTYTKEHIIFSDLEINIYRIADRNYDKLSPYDSYPVQVKGITSQTEWSKVAVTLRSYIGADGIEPYMTGKTDTEGRVIFNGMEEGLYLVTGVRSEAGDKVFTFYDFMIFVSENVTAMPKSGIGDPSDEKKTYTVLKLWKDDDSKKRPDSVTVDILKDGYLHETVILDSVNNWSYTFKTDSESIWSVVERDVPDEYFVTVTEKDATFIITNTVYDRNPDGTTSKPDTNAPQTGDTFPMKRYVVMLCVSGMLLVILGFGMRRKDDAKGR